jgi:integrase
LPYLEGQGIIRITKEDKAKSKKPALLPTEHLTNIFSDISFDNRKDASLSYILVLIGLTTGMRDSEIARMKREDIKYIKS